MSAQPEMSYAEEVLESLLLAFERILIQKGFDQAAARQVSFEQVEYMRQHWGGQQIYIVQGYKTELSRRDMQIWNEFNGSNHRLLAQKFNVCEDRIYKIVKHMLSQQVRLRQRDIFDDSAGVG